MVKTTAERSPAREGNVTWKSSARPGRPTFRSNRIPRGIPGDNHREHTHFKRPRPGSPLAAGPAEQKAVPGGGHRRHYQGHAVGLRDGPPASLARDPGEDPGHSRVRPERSAQRDPDHQRPSGEDEAAG